jgi:hypothetical protein
MHAFRSAGKCYVKTVVYDKNGRVPAGNFADDPPDPYQFSAAAGFVPQLDGIGSPGNRQLCNLRMGLFPPDILIGDYVQLNVHGGGFKRI